MTSPDPTPVVDVAVPTSTTPPPLADLADIRAQIQAQLPVADIAETDTPNPAMQLLAALHLTIGEDAVIASVNPALPGFQGKLAELLSSNLGPIAVVIENATGQRVNVPWHSIAMISKPLAPLVEQPKIDMTELENFMREQGMEIPTEVQAYINEEKQN